MPWKETRPVDERIQFIAAVAEDPRGNFARLCERFGISRAKGYKWLRRYEELGAAGLEDQQPVALTCPHRTPAMVIDRIVELRKEHPFDGPKKLRARLLATNDVELVVPAASTIGEILDRHGLIRPRRVRLRAPRSTQPLEEALAPNDLWATDFKGHFACGDKTRCHPLTVSDDATRFLIKCEGLTEPREAPVREQFERAFREFGMPIRIRSDNGPPFATAAIGGLSRLSVWWIRLGIVPERIEPGQPQQNGRHERMHRTLKQHTATPPAASFVEQQRAFDRFRADYNDHRPHEALAQTPPSRHYHPSFRAMPAVLRELEYADDIEIRRVKSNGIVSWQATRFQVGTLLGGQPLGFRQIEESVWEMLFGPVRLARVEAHGRDLRLAALR